MRAEDELRPIQKLLRFVSVQALLAHFGVRVWGYVIGEEQTSDVATEQDIGFGYEATIIATYSDVNQESSPPPNDQEIVLLYPKGVEVEWEVKQTEHEGERVALALSAEMGKSENGLAIGGDENRVVSVKGEVWLSTTGVIVNANFEKGVRGAQGESGADYTGCEQGAKVGYVLPGCRVDLAQNVPASRRPYKIVIILPGLVGKSEVGENLEPMTLQFFS